MLLCHELRDYTVLSFRTSSKHCYEAGEELSETLANRGQILDIYYEQPEDAYAIWVKIDNEVYIYYLFAYDAGVIEIW
jgi:hypothetical protein